MMRLVAALSAVPLVVAGSRVTLHRLGGGAGKDCSQCTVDQKDASVIEQKLRMTKGECAFAGFTVLDGSWSVDVLSVGSVAFEAYRKEEHGSPLESPEQPTTVTMRKMSQTPDECGEFALDTRFKTVAEEWLRMKEGRCSDLGYAEPVGNRSMGLPLVGGQVSVTLFKRADPLAELKKVGKGALSQVLAQAVGLPATRLPMCCESCEAGTLKYHDVHTEERQCNEVCMTPEAALMAQFLVQNLTAATSGAACASLGYGVYSKTVVKGLGVNVDVYEWGAVPAVTPEGWTTIHRPEGVECFQATAKRRYADVAVAVAGFKEGRCSDAGFTEEQDAQVPGLLTGEVKLTLFKKPGELSLVDAFRFTKDLFEEEGSPKREPSLVDFLV